MQIRDVTSYSAIKHYLLVKLKHERSMAQTIVMQIGTPRAKRGEN